MKLKISILLLSTLIVVPISYAWDGKVLGCPVPFNGDFEALHNCVEGKKNAAVKAMEDAKDEAIEEIESSPFMAKLQAEKDLLEHGRQSAVELAACLSEANIAYGVFLGNALSNPQNFVAGRLEAMLAEAGAAHQPLLQNMLNRAKTADPASAASLNTLVNEAYAAMLKLAKEDPVTNCAVPMLEAQAQQTKNIIKTVYPQIAQVITNYAKQTVQPAVTKNIHQMIGNGLQAHAKALGGQSGSTSNMSRLPKAKGQQTTSIVRKVGDRAAPVSRQSVQSATSRKRVATNSTSSVPKTRPRNQPRTRDAGSFLDQSVQTGIGLTQDFVADAIPDDLTRIALGEFTNRALPPPLLNTATNELDKLTTAVNNGNPGTVDTNHLETLLDQLLLSNQEMYTHIALATIREYGHGVINDAGVTSIDFAVGFIGGSEGAAEELVGIICSAGFFATGTPCGGVKAGIEFLVQWLLLPTIVKSMTVHAHMEWDRVVDCGGESLLAAEDVTADCSSIVAILPWFPKTAQQALDFAMPKLSETQQALENYQRAVTELVDATKSAG